MTFRPERRTLCPRFPWIAALILISAVAYGHLLAPGRILYSPHSDIVAYHLGTKEVLHRSLRVGEGLPLWRSDQLSGGPALTNPGSMYTYPLHFPFLFLSPSQAVGWVVWLHVALSAVGFLLLGQTMGLGRWPSFLMGVAGLFNFKIIIAIYAGWLPPSYSLLPWFFLAVFRVLANPGIRTGLLATATAAMALHAGQLQLVYYSLLFLVGYIAYRALAVRRGHEPAPLGRATAWLIATAVVGAGLSAYLLLPMFAEAGMISRTQASYESLQAGHSLGLKHLVTLWRPEALGTPLDGTYEGVELWEDVAYFGWVPLLLAAVGVYLGFRKPNTRYFALCFLLSLACALDTPLVRALYAVVPGFSLFRLPGRMLFMTAFFGIVLAGIGAEEVAARLPHPRRLGVGVMIVATAIMAGEGWSHVRRYLTTLPTNEALPKPDFVAALRKDTDLFRTATLGRDTVNPGWAAAFGLQLVSGYDPYNLSHYGDFMDLVRHGHAGRGRPMVWADLDRVVRPDALDVLNVKFVLSPVSLGAVPNLSFVERFADQPVFTFYRGLRRQDIYVYRNDSYLPRAFWVKGVLTGNKSIVRKQMEANDLRHVAVVENGVDLKSFPSKASSSDRVSVKSASDGALVLVTESESRRFLVISEVFHWGWRAALDGNPHPLERTDLALLGTWVPAGQHRLTLSFRPVYWRIGLTISGCSAAALIVLACVACRRKQRTVA